MFFNYVIETKFKGNLFENLFGSGLSRLGFEKENIICVDIPWTMDNNSKEKINSVFQNKLKDNPYVVQVSTSGRGVSREIDSPMQCIERNGTEIDLWGDEVDYNYIDFPGLELIEGRNFSNKFGTDLKESIIVNEAFLRKFGWQSVIDKTIRFNGQRKIIGVVKDYHSVHKRNYILPTVLILSQGLGSSPLIKIKPGYLRNVLELIENEWKQIAPMYPFSVEFLDAKIAKEYKDL